MKIYLKFFKNAFHSRWAYKFDAVFRCIGSLIEVFVQISVWTALYYFTNTEAIGSEAIGLQDMISYAIISTGISILAGNSVIYTVDNKIKTGEIATDFIRPIHFQSYMLATTLGSNLYDFIFRFLPLLVIFIPIYGLYIPKPETWIIFIITLVNGVLINFLMAYILGLVGFWYLSIWHLGRFLSDFTRLLSGSFVPIWFFPNILATISLFLPFRLIYFVPISIYLEKVTLSQGFVYILQQFGWIVSLYLLSRWVWNRGVDKLVVQGG